MWGKALSVEKIQKGLLQEEVSSLSSGVYYLSGGQRVEGPLSFNRR